MSLRRRVLVAILVALPWAALTVATSSADGQGTAIQIGGACSNVNVRADGLRPEASVLLTLNEVGQHGFGEVASSRRVVDAAGSVSWQVPGHALPDSRDCSASRQFTFSVFLVRADAKLGEKVAGPIDLQRGPSPSIVGHGIAGHGLEGAAGTQAGQVLLLIAVLGGAVALRAVAVPEGAGVTPRSRR